MIKYCITDNIQDNNKVIKSCSYNEYKQLCKTNKNVYEVIYNSSKVRIFFNIYNIPVNCNIFVPYQNFEMPILIL